MSYRSRLTLFFGLIVVVPMIAVAVLVIQLSSQSRNGKADARLAADFQVALAVYRDDQAANSARAVAITKDQQLLGALHRGDEATIASRVAQLVRSKALLDITITDPNGRRLASCCSASTAAASLTLRNVGGNVGTISVSATPPSAYLAEVHHLTGAEALLTSDSARLISTAGAVDAPADLGLGSPSASRTVDLPVGKRRARTVALAPNQRLTLLGEIRSGGVISRQPILVAILAVFFAAALALILPLLRDLQQLHELVEQQAVTDELTGLSNQRRFRELMAKEVERARRFGRPLSLLMMDVDDFKQVNDTYGHLQGDHVLHEVAKILQRESREIDEPARYGGEEFAVAMPETTAEGAVELAERVRKRIESTPIGLVGDSRTIEVRVSFGVAGAPESQPDVSGLIAAADGALYEAKRTGKNKTVKAA
jgi:diguanylate cyclase (GGDEF)-like protein